jgi:plastocyanin
MAYRWWLGSRMLAGALIGACLAGAPDFAQAEKRFFTIAAVEPKGGTTADKEPFPAAALPEGGGYVIKKPDQTGRWEVSAYVWQPSQIIVTEGDDVTLEFIGINGAEHPTTIVGYDKTLVLKRGHVIRIELNADKPGTFAIVCNHHKPSMVGELIVMPRK